MGKFILHSLLIGTCVFLSFMANAQGVEPVAANNGEQQRQPIVYTSPELQVISTGDRSGANTVVYTSPELQVISAKGNRTGKKQNSKKEPVVYTSPELQIKKD